MLLPVRGGAFLTALLVANGVHGQGAVPSPPNDSPPSSTPSSPDPHDSAAPVAASPTESAAPAPAPATGPTAPRPASEYVLRVAPEEQARVGVLMGLGLGAGRMQDTVTGYVGAAFDLHAGYAPTPNFAVVLSADALIHPEGSGALSDWGVALSAEAHVLERLRLSIGPGYYGLVRAGAEDVNGNRPSTTANSLGAEAGLGFEFFQAPGGTSSGVFLRDQLFFPDGKMVDSVFALVGIRWAAFGRAAAPAPAAAGAAVVAVASPPPIAFPLVCMTQPLLLGKPPTHEVPFASGADWDAYAADGMGTKIGPAGSAIVIAPPRGPVASMTHGQWIWRAEVPSGPASPGPQEAVFEKAFDLGDDPSGVIRITAEDLAIVYVNGQAAGCNGTLLDLNAGREPLSVIAAYPLAAYLKKGRNIVSVVVHRGRYKCPLERGCPVFPPGVLFEGILGDTNGPSVSGAEMPRSEKSGF